MQLRAQCAKRLASQLVKLRLGVEMKPSPNPTDEMALLPMARFL